jgi:polysaccharide biosynthesis/export protein
MMKNNCLQAIKRTGFTYLPILVGLFVTLLSSCTVSKQTQYFKTLSRDTTLKGAVVNNYESVIVNGDRLSINLSSISPAEDVLFNGMPVNSTTNISEQGYLVNENGMVQLHRLGNIVVAGLTRRALAKQLEKKLEAYVKDPIVKVSYLNHKVTVIGEVGKPTVLPLNDEQISIIDLLVQSGDVTLAANKKDITIIREEGTDRIVKHVNLEDNSIFSSPWYFIKPNDIVLVNTDEAKYVKAEKRNKLQNNLSLAATITSLAIIILSRVIK